jgi:hypothetical protein
MNRIYKKLRKVAKINFKEDEKMNRIYKKLRKVADIDIGFEEVVDCFQHYVRFNRDFEYDSTDDNYNYIILSGPDYEDGDKYKVEFDQDLRIDHVLSDITGEVLYARSRGAESYVPNELKPKLEKLCSGWDKYMSDVEMLDNYREYETECFMDYIKTNNDFKYYGYDYNIDGGILILDPDDEYETKYLIKFDDNHRIIEIIDHDTGEIFVDSGKVEHYVPNELKLKLENLCSEWNNYILNNVEEW